MASRLNQVCFEAVHTLGREQIIKAAEEFAELSAALLKYWAEPTDRHFDRLLDEYVDSVIMTCQMELLLNLLVRSGSTMDYKLSRLENLIKNTQEGVRT